MAENISDKNGRAFEYIIAVELAALPGNTLTPRAVADQGRDGEKFFELPENMQTRFLAGAKALVAQLKELEIPVEGISIDRLPDSAAQQGDVTDICLIGRDGKSVNLSIKNNHSALKHQRPPSLMQQLNFSKGLPEDVIYRQELQRVFNGFYAQAQTVAPNAVNFRDVESASLGSINRYLYEPVCALVARNLARYLHDRNRCQFFFMFLVGNTQYLKCILKGDSIEVTDFSAIGIPTACTVSHSAEQPSYIFLGFNNGWQISMRLHTAASAMGNMGGTPSTKFDTQPIALPSFPQYIRKI